MESLLFWIMSVVAVGGAILTVSRSNPLSSAVALTVTLVAVAGLFATLSAPFLFVIQLLVYAGAVMVLVIYVIMLLNLKEKEMRLLGMSRARAFLSALAAVLLVALLAKAQSSSGGWGAAIPATFGETKEVAQMIFTTYVYPFEVVSVLLLAAVIGAVMMAMRKF